MLSAQTFRGIRYTKQQQEDIEAIILSSLNQVVILQMMYIPTLNLSASAKAHDENIDEYVDSGLGSRHYILVL